MAKRKRINSKITQLPENIKSELDAMLMNTSNSYTDITVWLNSKGHSISRSAVGRYAIRLNETAQRIVETLEKTKAIVQAVEKSPDLDYTKAARLVMMDGLLQKVASSEEEFLEMPIDKAGRLIASLTRAEIYDQKTKRDIKSKMDLALDAFEGQLMDKIKGDRELASEVTALLKKVRDSVHGKD